MTCSPASVEDTWGTTEWCAQRYESYALPLCPRQTRKCNDAIVTYCAQHQAAHVILSPRHPRLQLPVPFPENSRVVVQDKHVLLQLTYRPEAVLVEVLLCYYTVMVTVTLETAQSMFIEPRQQTCYQFLLGHTHTLILDVERVRPAHTPIVDDLYALFIDMDLEMELWFAKLGAKEYSVFYQCKKTRQLYCCCTDCPDIRRSFPTLRDWAAHYTIQTVQPGRYVLAQYVNGVICAHPSAQLQPHNPQLQPHLIVDIIAQHGYAWRSLGDKKKQKQFALQLQQKLERLARI
jgi:hypothetical protein